MSLPVTDRRRIKFVCSTPVAFVLAQMCDAGAIMLKSARQSTENVGTPRFVSAYYGFDEGSVRCHSTCLPPGKELKSVSKKGAKVRRCFNFLS
jgi:hypothetical protein